MHGIWSWQWHSVLLVLLLHIVLYALIFLFCAFFAARHFRRMRNPERKSLRASQDKSLEGGNQGASSGEDTLWQELQTFAGDPLPFLRETADADDDTVQQRAGLDARLYLRMVWCMMIIFGVIAAVAVFVMLPLNLMAERAPWFPTNSFLMTTANGFAHPDSALVFHTMFTCFIALSIVGVVYVLRSEMEEHVKGAEKQAGGAGGVAVPPVQAYTVEITGLRLDPPVRAEEVEEMLKAHELTKGKVLEIEVVIDVADLVDVVENARLLRAKLARYHEQHERDGERPRVCQGVFSFMYMGEWTDAIELCEKEIAQNDAEATSLRLQSGRVAAGTAFATFTTRQAAIDCIKIFKDAKVSNAACGHPTLPPPPKEKAKDGKDASGRPPAPGEPGSNAPLPLCRNASQWSMSMAPKPEDVYWRNLRFSKWHHVLLSITGFTVLLVVLSFIVTPIFFLQIFINLGEDLESGAGSTSYSSAEHGSFEEYYEKSVHRRSNRVTLLFAGILWPALVLLINFVVMPVLVHYSVRFFGHRQVSAMRRSSFNLICFFMVTNLLIIPGLALNGLDALWTATIDVPLDRLLAQILIYGSSGSFFVDYVAQAGLLTAAFYFIYHTTSPLLVDWASGGHEKSLTFEFDFSYFYSSMLAVFAIGLMFAATVPIVLPLVAAVCVLRYYTDKWQLLTAHSTLRVDPAPEMTASANHFALLMAAALAQAAFASWLWIQGARTLALCPLICFLAIGVILAVPYTRDNCVIVNPRWSPGEDGLVDQPDSLSTPAPASYRGAYQNPYLKEDATDRTSKLWGAMGGFY